MIPRSALMIGLLFGLCASANVAASMFAGCSRGFDFRPSDPCGAVMAGVNCTFCIAIVWSIYQMVNSSGGGGGYV